MDISYAVLRHMTAHSVAGLRGELRTLCSADGPASGAYFATATPPSSWPTTPPTFPLVLPGDALCDPAVRPAPAEFPRDLPVVQPQWSNPDGNTSLDVVGVEGRANDAIGPGSVTSDGNHGVMVGVCDEPHSSHSVMDESKEASNDEGRQRDQQPAICDDGVAPHAVLDGLVDASNDEGKQLDLQLAHLNDVVALHEVTPDPEHDPNDPRAILVDLRFTESRLSAELESGGLDVSTRRKKLGECIAKLDEFSLCRPIRLPRAKPTTSRCEPKLLKERLPSMNTNGNWI